MSQQSDKGYRGEVEAASFFDSLVSPTYHICRIGGTESKKHSFAGDVCVVNYCKPHGFAGKAEDPCYLDRYFIEVKNQKRVDIWADMRKASDDASLAGKVGAIGYFRKAAGRGYSAEEVIVMRPETFKLLMKQK